MRIPEVNVSRGIFPLPDKLGFEEATFIEPLACTLRGQKKIPFHPEQTALVIGSGPAGLLHIALARSRGFRRVLATDLIPLRLEAALKAGADTVLRSQETLSQEVKRANEGRLADLVIVCAGAEQAALRALECTERGGTVLFFAIAQYDQIIPLSMNDLFWQRGITLTSSYAASPDDLRESIGLLREGRVNVRPMITHRLSLREAATGFKLTAEGKETIKVILDPTR